jgi:hypothetical protein
VKIFCITLIAACIQLLFLNALAGTGIDRFNKSGSNVFVISEKGNSSRIKLDIAISDWRVDCTKTRAVIWGEVLKKLPDGVMPYTKFYVVNILKKRVLHSYTRNLRVYGVVEFDKNSEIIIVDEDVIDFKSGAVKQIGSVPVFQKENCPDFQGRRPSL